MALYIYFSVLVIILIVVAIIFNGLDYALSTGQDSIIDVINNTENETLSSQSIENITTLNSVWMYFPVLMIILVIVWSLIQAQKEGV